MNPHVQGSNRRELLEQDSEGLLLKSRYYFGDVCRFGIGW